MNQLSGEGEATHLGRFTLVSVFTVIPPPVSTASGTATWTAANGDEISTTFSGRAVVTFPTAAIVETHPSPVEPADSSKLREHSSSSVL